MTSHRILQLNAVATAACGLGMLATRSTLHSLFGLGAPMLLDGLAVGLLAYASALAVETGRTQPSRQALLVLAETLDVPLRERNRLLEAGGYAHLYRQTALAADEMSHIRGVLQFILDRHKPYAAMVLDRYANCMMGNGASERLVAALVDSSLLTEHMNLLRIVFHPLGARRFIVNWEEVAHHLLGRAEREFSRAKDDEMAASLLGELRGYAGPVVDQRRSAPVSAGDLLLPIHIRTGDFELRIFSTIMTLGTPQDVTLQELRIETFFPADSESEATWMRLTALPGT